MVLSEHMGVILLRDYKNPIGESLLANQCNGIRYGVVIYVINGMVG